jgi:CubicO group peptidase (beta-lactamase class C family)
MFSAGSCPASCASSAGGATLMQQPGERWMYNTGAEVLGVLIARASGMPLGRFFQERIFDPLGMRDTGFSVPPSNIGRTSDSPSKP